ncbi:MAG: hypothetical protein LBS48_00410, partial [Treponema sp.]|nr:hypothetical protein [Treponema sp.]
MVSKISVILRSLVAALVIACFLSCENPFKSGLGKKVDIVPPTLSVTAPDLPVEYYIHGITVFKGQAGDDRGISSVQVKAGGAPFVDVDSYDPVTNEWIYKFNTLYDTAGSGQIRPDGDMILIFRAVDIDGKNYDTNEIKHYIKNSPPKLELEYPVRRWLYDPDRFNKPIYENTSSYENLGVLPTGGEIRGIVSDKDGIDPWYPKIQFWAAGDTPPDFEDESQWYGTEISPSQVGEKLIAKEFRYTLVPRKYHKYDANNNHLGFVNPDIDPDALIPASELGDYLPINVQYKYRLKVKDSFGIVQYYPPGASDGYELNSDESDYVYISAPAASDVISLDLRAAEEKPVVEITNPLRTTGTNGVPTGIRPSADYPDNIYHPYVTAGNVSFKHDDFVFQVQATHSEGVVKFAVLSYEYRTFNDPNSLNPVAQGVLEWDAPDLESGWAGNTVIMEDGNPAKVFTFSTSKNVFDKYLGENWSSYNSNPGADPDLVDALYGNAKGSGSHPPDLKRGIYKFKVRTYSVSSSWRLREFTINVDNQEPKIDIKIIEGADFDESTDTYLVNGFVKVRLLAFDEQTRLRTYLPDEANPLAWVEQKWVLSNSGDSNLVKSHVFPVNRATGAGTAYENTVFTVNTAADNLPVVMVNPDTSVFAGTASLDDGNSYYLYMVARDAAYNVGISSVEILVDQAWDKPRIESPDADFRLEAVGSSTWTADQLMPGVTVDGVTDPYKRNRLNGTDIIPLFLADDDSLHLEKTRVWITREGMDDNVVPDPAQPEAVYNEKWWKLPQETIKLVFGENLDYHSETNPNNVRKERDATLTLAHLATALNKNNDRLPYWNSQRPSAVPEGKYKIRIQAQDYLDVKKAISTVSENPDESGAEGLEEAFNHKEFWISVDTRGPNLYGILPGQNSQAKGEVILRGVVRDAGEVETFRVLPPYKPGPNGLPATAADWVDIMTTPAVPEDWSWEPRPWKAGDQYYEYDWTYKGNVDHGNLTTSDSERTFSIHAVDKFGNAENASRTLMIDNERPVVSMLIGMPTVPDASTGLNVNGTVRFTVGIEEDYPALPPLKYYFRPTASTAITVPALGPDFDPQVENNYPVANPPLTVLDLDDVNLASQISDKIWEDATEIVKDAANTYTVTINTRDDALYTDGQWYRLYVIGKDLADNYSVSKDPGKPTETARARLELMNLQTVKINQATDKPVFSNVRPNRDYVGQDATMFVSGTVKDDDGFTDPADPDNVPLNAIEIRFLDINRNPIGDWRNLGYHAENSVTVRESGKTLDFRFKIPKPVPDVEGEYFFELRASDHTKRKYNDPPVTAVTDPPYSYNYDMTPPKIVFDDSDFNKSFRAYPSKYFYIGIIEKKLNPVASSSGSVPGLQFNFANTGLSNSGLYYDYDDEDPGEDYISKTLKRVSLDPSDTDADALYEAGDRTAIIETIEGQTKTYSIDSASADYNPDLKIFKIPSKSLEQKRRWDELSGNTAPLLTEGTHTILFQALDQAGLRNSRDFSFKKDITGPDIRFEGIRKSFTADGASVVKHAASGDLAVKGLFSDAQTPIWITGAVEPEFTYRLYNVNLSDLTDEKALTAFDVPRQLVLSGQTNELTAPWSVSLKTATPMAGYTGGYIADGLHKLKLEIKDRIGNAGNLVSSSGDSPEGVYFYTDSKKPETISVKAVDPSAPATEYTSKVFAASGSPVFRIMGSSEDANLSAVTIRIGSAVAPEVNITSSGTFVDTESSGVFMRTLDWSYDVPNLPNSAYDLLADNQEHKIYIYAKDLAGNSTVTEWVFFKDSNSPVIDFTSMNAGTTLLSTSRPEIKGSATDDNRIKELSSVIQKWDYAAANSSEGIASEQPGAWNGELEGAATLLPSGYPAEGRASQSWSKSFTTLASGDPGYDGGIDGARLYIPDGMYRIKVTAKDNSAGAAAGNPVDTGWKIFFVDKTAPVFTLKENNPYIGTAGGNIKLSGTVQDNNRIRRVRIKLNSQDFDTGTVTSWTPPTETDKKSSGVINWEVPAFPVSGSSFTVYLEAEDWAGNKTALQQAYIADNNPPTLNPIYPAPVEGNAQPARLRGRELIQGTADDDRGLELLKIAVGSVDIAAAEADWKNWDSDSANPHYDGTTVPIIREGTNYSWSLKIANVNNLVTGATTAAANNWVSWVNPASTSSYAPPLTGSLRDSNIWALPVKIWMKDLAGNTDTKDFTYWIDPYGDLPSVEINSPKNNGIVGGAVTVNGSATDNARVENVAYRVRTGPGYDTSVALEDFGAVLHAPSNALGTVTPDPGTSSPPANSPNNWYTAAIAGGNRAAKVQWNFKINTTGQFNPGAASTNRIYIDVMGWDSVQNASGEYLPANTDKQAGWFKTIEVDVEKGVPEFLSYFILQGTYASHTAVGESRLLVDPLNGDFYIETEVTDESRLDSISYRKPGGDMENILSAANKSIQWDTGNTAANWDSSYAHPLTISGGAIMPETDGLYHYKLHIKTNLDSLQPAPDKAGTFLLAIHATDESEPAHYTGELNLTVQVDNFFPLSSYTGSSYVVGTNYSLQGKAWDEISAEPFGVSVGDIKKVEAWFKSGSNYYDTLHAASTSTMQLSGIKAGRYVNGSVIETPASYPGVSGGTVNRPVNYLTIDRNEVTDDDGDGIIEGWVENGADKEWSAIIDTSVLPAGPITLCYLVYDIAGNATYYENSLVVRNGGPSILGVSLGTNLYKDLSFTTGSLQNLPNQEKVVTTNFSEITGFAVRNQGLHVRAMVSKNT